MNFILKCSWGIETMSYKLINIKIITQIFHPLRMVCEKIAFHENDL